MSGVELHYNLKGEIKMMNKELETLLCGTDAEYAELLERLKKKNALQEKTDIRRNDI
jgi:hypothetical protein